MRNRVQQSTFPCWLLYHMEKEAIVNAFQEPPTDMGASLSSWPVECLSFKEAPCPLHVLLGKLPHHALADMPGPVCPLCSLCSPGLLFVGIGGDSIPPGPTHTLSATHMRAATSLQVSALPGLSPRSGPVAMISCSATECACRSTLQIMFY